MSHIIEPIITVIEETKEDIERKKATAYFVNMKMTMGSTGLVFAIKKNNTDITRILLEHGADPNLEGVEMSTPLHYAVEEKNVEMIRLLLNHGADPNLRSKEDMAPLHRAVQVNDTAIVQLLLDYDANPNLYRTKTQRTALHEALYVDSPNPIIVKMLLDAGADCTLPMKEGFTVLHKAIKLENVEIIKLLLTF